MNEYPGYAIRSDGTVENTKTARILKPGINNGGYYQVSLKNRDGLVKYQETATFGRVNNQYIITSEVGSNSVS